MSLTAVGPASRSVLVVLPGKQGGLLGLSRPPEADAKPGDTASDFKMAPTTRRLKPGEAPLGAVVRPRLPLCACELRASPSPQIRSGLQAAECRLARRVGAEWRAGRVLVTTRTLPSAEISPKPCIDPMYPPLPDALRLLVKRRKPNPLPLCPPAVPRTPASRPAAPPAPAARRLLPPLAAQSGVRVRRPEAAEEGGEGW